VNKGRIIRRRRKDKEKERNGREEEGKEDEGKTAPRNWQYHVSFEMMTLRASKMEEKKGRKLKIRREQIYFPKTMAHGRSKSSL
jgi:hypothetical protein